MSLVATVRVHSAYWGLHLETLAIAKSLSFSGDLVGFSSADGNIVNKGLLLAPA